jgi:hypothetical protein
MSRKTLTVPCLLDIEVTPESVHAHAVPEGVTLYPGDQVLVHGAPSHIAFGDCYTRQCTATITRAGLLTRLLTRARAWGQITELYEVSFAPAEG